jgi:hypothetical protein
VLAFVNECRWDPKLRKLRTEVKSEIGRRMTTSSSNRVSPNNKITPDCVIEIAKLHGIIAEVKLGLPRNEQVWDQDIEQLQKYDDDLAGWWTSLDERIQSHDVVALIPLSRAVKFADRLDDGIKEGKWIFGRKLAVVGFFKTSGAKDFLSLKKERGSMSVSSLDDRLRESVQIDIGLIISKYNDRKFVDHMPPLPYLLQIIWDHIFTGYAADSSPDGPSIQHGLTVSLSKVTRDLQDYYGSSSSGPRSPEIPRSVWVKKALDALVSFKMAAKKESGIYEINYRRTKGDTLKKFGKLCFDLDQKTKSIPVGQLPLIPEIADK